MTAQAAALREAAERTEGARSALRERDDAIRKAVANGASVRAVAKATGLSRPGIDRIVARGDSDSTRW